MGKYTLKINYRHIKIRLFRFAAVYILFVDVGYENSTRTFSSWGYPSICISCICIHYHVLINSVNFGREVNSLTSSGREFQILGSNVLRLFSVNVVVFALLITKSFFLLVESRDLTIVKSYKLQLLISANGSLSC